MAYPTTLDSFTTKVDGVDTILASHTNALQASIVAIETILGYGGTLPSSVQSALTIALRNSNGATTFNGVIFPASQAALSDPNTLDDYEEGVWTPAFGVSSGLTGSWTYSKQFGKYTKIGRLVHCVFSLAWNAKPSAGSALRLGGIPFNIEDADNCQGFVSSCWGVTFTSRTGGTGSQIAITAEDTTHAGIYVFGSGSTFADSRMDVSALASSGTFAGAFIYYTTT